MRPRYDELGRGLFGAVLVLLAMVGLFLIGGGCAGAGPNLRTAVTVAGDLIECAPAEYQAIDDAIRNGGASWIGVVLELVHCAPKVIHDLALSPKVAGPEDGAQPLSRGARRRLRVAVVLARVIGPPAAP